MAAQITHDVVKEAQSMSDASLIDDIANSTNVIPAGNGQAYLPPDAVNGDQSNGEHGAQRHGTADSNAPLVGKDSPDSAIELEIGLPLGEGGGAQGGAVDLSGGSDTDTSKPDSLDQIKDPAKGHVRSNSVKKPAAFKSVSFTKNFLAKAATAAPSTRTGDKGSPASQSGTSTPVNARPRLVAKTALGGSGSRSGLSRLNGAGGPDPLKVWNRNRPVAPPPPRQFTDEELKQQYGIHMATRLQADESGKDKWADIEDDEDDWAPETVEWVDGTKSSVVQTAPQSVPQPPEEVKAPVVQKPEPMEAPTPPPATALSSKTILKPGILAGGLPKLSGAGGRSPADKPALVSKSPAAPPAKNPWASLPPVDKVPPVFPNPPQPPAQSPFRRDPHGFESLPPPPPGPTREIAADDFDRSWRDDRGVKELFNSRSGRYEPVNEMRRGSMRDEHGFRQPAVLQRPSFSEKPAPAEPSPAFQTHRSSGPEGASWSRRRTSSNVSSSGGRRPSFSRSMDVAEGVSPGGGLILESPQPIPATVDRTVQPTVAGHRPWTRESPIYEPQSSPILLDQGTGAKEEAVAEQPQEDAVARQQRLMRDKIEAARMAKQRELEEEQRLETAKKERLRKKMEALAAATPSPELKDVKPKETHSAPRSPQPLKQAAIISPPKPPIPTAEGEVAQYGMMKVHQPHPVKRAVVNEAALEKKANTNMTGGARDSAGVARPPQPIDALGASGTNTGISAHDHNQHRGPASGSEAWRQQPAASAVAYNWTNNSGKSYSAQTNVWGPPQNNSRRGLGNGTFASYNSGEQQQARQEAAPPSLLDSPATGSTLKTHSPPTPPASQSASLQPPFPQPSAQFSQLSRHSQHAQQPAQSNFSQKSFPPSSYNITEASSTKMGAPPTPSAATFEEAGATKAAAEKLGQAKLEHAADEVTTVDSFETATKKALEVAVTHKSGPGMKPIFAKRYDWNLAPDATTKVKTQAWHSKFDAASDLEKGNREEIFAKPTVFTRLDMDPSAVTPSNLLKGAAIKDNKSATDSKLATEKPADAKSEPARESKSTYVPIHLRPRKTPVTADPAPVVHYAGLPDKTTAAAAARSQTQISTQTRKSKFQPLFDDRRVGTTAITESNATNSIAPAVGGPPAGTDHLFALKSTGPKVKLPVVAKVKLPSGSSYKHLEAPASSASNAKHWHNKIHNLVHDDSVSAATKTALAIDAQPARVSLTRTTINIIARYGIPDGTWDSRWAHPGMQAAFHDWKANVKPTDEELFEEPQFASRPNVRAPKQPHQNAQLPPVHVDSTPRPARNDPVTISAMEIDMTPAVKGGLTELRVKMAGAVNAKVLPMRKGLGRGYGPHVNRGVRMDMPRSGGPRNNFSVHNRAGPSAGPMARGGATAAGRGPTRFTRGPMNTADGHGMNVRGGFAAGSTSGSGASPATK